MLAKTNDSAILTTRWVARGLGILAAIFFLLFVFRNIFPDFMKNLPDLTMWAVVLLIVIAVVGVVLSWFWEGLAGLLIVLAGIGMAILVAVETEKWCATLVYALPWVLAGHFLLFSWWQTRK